MESESLKQILGDELFKKINEKLTAYNENPKNKDKQVKLANITEGKFIAKEEHDTIVTENQTNIQKLTEANALIEQLKKSTKGDETLQTKIGEYQAKVTRLESELMQTKIDSAVKVGLMAEKAVDIDYLIFKLKEKGDKLELDEQGNIKGWSDKVAALKTQLPAQFESSSQGTYNGFKPIEKGKESGGQTLTKEDILKKPYAERNRIFNENPEMYNQIMKG